MKAFQYSPLPARVIFGFGTIARLGDEMDRLGCSRAVLVTTPEQSELASAGERHLRGKVAGRFSHAKMHTPVDVTDRALEYVSSVEADCLVGLGGGSTTGLCKAVALRTDLSQIILPTTYAGSEATPILGETTEGRKKTQHSLSVLPESIVYDVDLTMTLPKRMSAVSGMNAIAHAVEALYAKDVDPIISLIAKDGIRSLSQALPTIMVHPGDRDARSDALYGAWACGSCLGAVGMALHHKLCHMLGGAFNLPHAETHAIILPHVAAYNQPAASDALGHVARSMGTDNAARGLYDLNCKLGIPLALRDIGMKESGIAEAVNVALSSSYWNPRPVEREPLTKLLEDAYFGRAPRKYQ